jgi:hypothetical protein
MNFSKSKISIPTASTISKLVTNTNSKEKLKKVELATLENIAHEFDHWLNGGKLLCYTEVEGPYYEVTDEKWDFVCNIGFIINDEYVEFRKALAEGKTIQYKTAHCNWIDYIDNKGNPCNIFGTGGTYSYRIKPDEPKFKVGDFVRYVHSTPAKALEINNINGNRYYFTNSEMSCLEYELELWTPVKGEWCWFWDKCTPHRPTLRQYDIFPEGYSEENMFHDSEQNPFDFCEPFLNSRPSYLKDK